MADVVVCDEQLLFGEALAAVLRRRGTTALAVPDLGALAELECPGSVTHVVVGVNSVAMPSADDIDRIRATCPGAVVVCMAELLTQDQSWVGSGADLLVSKKMALDDVVRAVLGRPLGDDPRATVSPAAEGRPRRREAKPLPAQFLTAREQEVLRLLVVGESTQGIAHGLGVTRSTARCHVQSVLDRLGVHSRVEAVRYAVFHDLVDLDRGMHRGERTAR